MTDHLKLTDESLDRYERRILGDDFTDDEIDQLFAAIRALRDAARAVVQSRTKRYLDDPDEPPVMMADDALLDALAALLPDEPKGGGS